MPDLPHCNVARQRLSDAEAENAQTGPCARCRRPRKLGVSWCPECHAKEMARIHQYDTPATPEVPVRDYQPPDGRGQLPHPSGRRMFRKEKGYQ